MKTLFFVICAFAVSSLILFDALFGALSMASGNFVLGLLVFLALLFGIIKINDEWF